MSVSETEKNDADITNVFVLMLENHSFDNVFAMSGIEKICAATTANSNEYDGQQYSVKNGAPERMVTDPGHEFADVAQQLSCKNGGFAMNFATSRSEGTGVPAKDHIGDIMACFDTPKQLPVINQLAREYAICDHWFSSMPGPTWPNRFFVHGASSACLDRSPTTLEEVGWESHIRGYEFEKGTIYKALDDHFNTPGMPKQHRHSWRLYNDFWNRYREEDELMHGGWIPQVACLKGVGILDVHHLHSPKVPETGDGKAWVDNFANDLQTDYPYPYTFIEPNFGRSFFDKQPPFEGPGYRDGSSQHPEDDPYGGECLIKGVYEAIRNSPIWNTSLLVIVYDEHGGFYDHVSPDDDVLRSKSVPPGDSNVNGLKGLNGFDFKRFGVRVPAVIVSPRIKAGTVDKTVYDHTSILATVERMFGMEPLTNRDKVANDFRHLFENQPLRSDAECPKQLVEPAPPSAQAVRATTVDIDQPLPESGNWLGFLHILLKTELEISAHDQKVQAEILEKFKKIKTISEAKSYIKSMGEKIIEARLHGV